MLRKNKKQQKVIDKAIEYIEKDYYSKNTFDIDNIGMTTNKLLQVRNILKEVSEWTTNYLVLNYKELCDFLE